ncbi:peptidoglycan-binding domain-containing protein [Calothrix sp. CCY 0018]|uniref:peptidoglycan-binding domain-containing protein n=1 Tax=Calothrix sp. CCY 0018 TaxID=3103864 RepID=UPI0039C69959
MKKLADTQIDIRHEDLNPPSKLRAFVNIKHRVLNVVKSIAIAVACITAGVVAGTAAQAETVHKTFSYGDRGSGIATLQSKLGGIAVDGIFGSETLRKLKSYQAANRLPVNGIATPETLVSLGLDNLSQRPLQYGKLKLVNDTQYEAIVFLYAPGEAKYSRYVYIPPCHERKMSATYSNGWQVSIDRKDKVSLGNLTGGDFKFHLSSLPVESKFPQCTGTRIPSERTSTSGLQLVQYISSGENKVARGPIKNPLPILSNIGKKIARIGNLIESTRGLDSPRVLVATTGLGNIFSPETASDLISYKNAVSDEQIKATETLLAHARRTNISSEELAKFVKNKFDESQDTTVVLQKIKNYLDDCYPKLDFKVVTKYAEVMLEGEGYKRKADGWSLGADRTNKDLFALAAFRGTFPTDGKTRISASTSWTCVRWDYHSFPPAYLISYRTSNP